MRNKIIAQACAWVGKNEADGSHKEIIDVYNSHKPLARGYKVKYTGDAWCATFISALAIKCGMTDIIPLECSCGKMIELAANMGIFREDDTYIPAIADIILYDWGDSSGKGDNTGWADHIGIVESVKNGVITVIEGNLNDKVARREIAINGRYIRGYICPVYEVEKNPAQTAPKTECYPKYNGTSNSIVDALKAVGVDASYNNRKAIAEINGISDYAGKAAQNSKLLSLLKDGNLVKCSTKPTEAQQTASKVKYYKKYTGNTNSLVDALKSLKIDSSFTHRSKIAKANGISLYVGTAKQNTTLLNLLKQGKLVKE